MELPGRWAELGYRTAVEVGTERGVFAEHLLASLPDLHLTCVDPWAYQPDWKDMLNDPQTEQDARYEETRTRLAPFGSRVTIWRMTSLAAASDVPDGSLDAVYLDARHDRASVAADLQAWRPKIRPGGMLCGHDYLTGTVPGNPTVFGVKEAVDAMFPEVEVTTRDVYPTWMVTL